MQFGKPTREIGESFGVTKERIRQIEGKALLKLRNVLQDQVAEGPLMN